MITESRPTILGLTWGVLLLMMGCGVFYRTHQLGSQIDAVAGTAATALFIRICLYIMSILLVGGGIKKIRHHYGLMRAGRPDR